MVRDSGAIDVSPLDTNLLDTVVRLVRLLDSPAEVRVLRPLITREIIYRLLMGEQGNRLRHQALLGGHTDRITEAVEDYDAGDADRLGSWKHDHPGELGAPTRGEAGARAGRAGGGFRGNSDR
jgi:hypothetical protein